MFLLVPAHPDRPGQRAVKRSCVYQLLRHLLSTKMFQENTLNGHITQPLEATKFVNAAEHCIFGGGSSAFSSSAAAASWGIQFLYCVAIRASECLSY